MISIWFDPILYKWFDFYIFIYTLYKMMMDQKMRRLESLFYEWWYTGNDRSFGGPFGAE